MTGGSSQDHHGSAISRAVIAASLVGGSFALVGTAVVDAMPFVDALGPAVAFVAFGLVGGVILRQNPRHRMGWLFTYIAFAGIWSFVTGVLTAIDNVPVAFHGVAEASWWPVMFGVFVVLPLWFPTGYPVSRRWSWVAWFGGAATVAVVTLSILAERVCTFTYLNPRLDAYVCLEWSPNPIGVRGLTDPESGGIGGVVFLVMGVMFLVALVSVVLRFRRSEGLERQQLKWFAYSMGLLILWAVVTDWLVIDVLGFEEAAFSEAAGAFVFPVLLTAVPVSAGMAIMKYRLYDIDRMVSRAVTYTLVVGVLAVVFAAGAVWIPTILPTSDSNLAVAATTLVVFFLFRPLRTRVQQVVDRRFNRSRYDAQQIADEFTGHLRDEVDPVTVANRFVGVVRRTMEPASVGMWVKEVRE